MDAGRTDNGEGGASFAPITFPRAMKRGAKVRTGPSAQVIQFPLRLTGDDLCNCWAWMSTHHRDWRSDVLDGRYESPDDWEATVRIAKTFSVGLDGRELDEEAMRRDVSQWRQIVEKRIRLKELLRQNGACWQSLRSAEDALIFLAGRMQSQALPSSA